MMQNLPGLARLSGHSIRRKAPALALVLILLGCAVGVTAAAPAAPEVPESGHAFYGHVRTATGVSLPAGTPIVARTPNGAWTGSANCTSTAGGLYGYNPVLLVPADDPDTPAIEGARDGDEVVFFVLGVRAANTYRFDSGGLTQLDLVVAINYTITATEGPGGSILPLGAVQVAYGGSQTFTITPNTGYAIADVAVDGASQGPIGSYTFSNVTADHTIAATFRRITHRVYLPLIRR